MSRNPEKQQHAPGTLVLAFIFLAVFVTLDFVNWALLSRPGRYARKGQRGWLCWLYTQTWLNQGYCSC